MQPGTDFQLARGHQAILLFEEGWDVFPAPLQREAQRLPEFTIEASLPTLGNIGRELSSRQGSQIPLYRTQGLCPTPQQGRKDPRRGSQ